MEIKQLKSNKEAKRILDFFFSGYAFPWQLSRWRQEGSIKERVNNALEDRERCCYWFFEDNVGKVMAAGGIEKDGETNGGFFVGWFAVHKEYRRQGLGRKIMGEAERHAKSQNGRFITIETAEDNLAANAFYKSLGFRQVGSVPDYYKKGVAKIIYWKDLI